MPTEARCHPPKVAILKSASRVKLPRPKKNSSLVCPTKFLGISTLTGPQWCPCPCSASSFSAFEYCRSDLELRTPLRNVSILQLSLQDFLFPSGIRSFRFFPPVSFSVLSPRSLPGIVFNRRGENYIFLSGRFRIIDQLDSHPHCYLGFLFISLVADKIEVSSSTGLRKVSNRDFRSWIRWKTNEERQWI